MRRRYPDKVPPKFVFCNAEPDPPILDMAGQKVHVRCQMSAFHESRYHQWRPEGLRVQTNATDRVGVRISWPGKGVFAGEFPTKPKMGVPYKRIIEESREIHREAERRAEEEQEEWLKYLM